MKGNPTGGEKEQGRAKAKGKEPKRERNSL